MKNWLAVSMHSRGKAPRRCGEEVLDVERSSAMGMQTASALSPRERVCAGPAIFEPSGVVVPSLLYMTNVVTAVGIDKKGHLVYILH